VRTQFELPLDLDGTAFQRRAWLALAEIPYGETRSYAEQARRLQTGARAVGSANARNPLPIVLPCHRLVGTNGSLTGYGGGLELKEQLLRLEGATSPSAPRRTRARRR
jgi:methylated-DNA-[protein]-cysteine S-methyltransferase